MIDVVLAGTGHRPGKLDGYEPEAQERLIVYATKILPFYKPKKVILGMAMGWDQALAWACVRLGVLFIAAVPFVGQEKRWHKETQESYHLLLTKAAEVVIVCEGGYHPDKLQKRNIWMVDRSTAVLALWDGSKGGTANCVKYAEKVSVPVFNVWPGWLNELEDLTCGV